MQEPCEVLPRAAPGRNGPLHDALGVAAEGAAGIDDRTQQTVITVQ